jgi:DNA invertase Pin-like site-specific DNA recombinase
LEEDTTMGKKTPRCVKAVAYIRTSTSHQEISPQDQQERIAAYCAMAGLQLVETITEQVSARSHRLYKRPEGQRIRHLTANGVCHIVTLKLDRMFRSASDCLHMVEEWEQAGIALHLVDMGGISIDTTSRMGKMLLTMLAGFAEFEASVIRERTSAAFAYKKAHSQVYKHVPYGQRATEDGQLVPDLEEQAVITRMRAWRAEGTSYARIAAQLNEDGVPTKQGGAGWHAQTVANILDLTAGQPA